MAFCVKCGGQLAEGARFCTSCGAPAAPPSAGFMATASVTSVPPAASPAHAQSASAPGKKRSPRAWIAPALVVGLVALGAAGWFAFGLLSGGTAAGRAKAQVETVAEYMQGYYEGDLERVQSVLPTELADEVEAAFDSGAEIGTDVEVTREWDGDVLTVTFTTADSAPSQTLRLTADGGKRRGVVTLEQGGTDGYAYEAVVAREAGRWVLVEIDGVSIGDAWAGIGALDASDEAGSGEHEYIEESNDDDGSDTSGSSGSMQADNEAAECMANQEIIESVLWDYIDQEGYDDTVPLAGDLSWDHPIVADGYLEVPPSCASARSAYYYIARDGTTSCPTGAHPYYLDEQ